MTEDRQAEIARRAELDAHMTVKHKQPTYCPYSNIEEAQLWRVEFDMWVAELRGKT